MGNNQEPNNLSFWLRLRTWFKSYRQTIIAGIGYFFLFWIIFFLEWYLWFLTQLYNIDRNLSLTIAALLVSSLAAIASIWSIYYASKSLDMAKSSIRPFLSAEISYRLPENEKVPVIFTISNRGSLPADHVTNIINFFDASENITETNSSNINSRFAIQSGVRMLFPNNKYEIENILYF